MSLEKETNHFVVFDTDIGCDDAWALFIILKAEEIFKKIKILAITCVNGNVDVDTVAINACRVLNAAERNDIPIYKGSKNAILPNLIRSDYFHGKDGLGDVYHDDVNNTHLIKSTHAVTAMYDLACKYPKQISFLLVGPLTNFALCLTMYADFAEKVKDVFIMGGNQKGVGNSSSCAEFNFHIDPEAAFIVLNNAKCPVTILPLETCASDELKLSMDWRFNTLGSIPNKFVQFMNPVDKAIYPVKKFEFVPYDAFLSAAFILPEKIIKKSSNWHASVELSGLYTRGQMVLDHKKTKTNNVNIIEKVDHEIFKKILLCINGKDIEI